MRSASVRAAAIVVVLLLAVVAAPVAAQEPLRPPVAIGAAWPPAGWPPAPSVSADAYLLADLATGQVLAARAPDERRPVASTVKILTAVTVLRRMGLADAVTVGPEVDGFAADAAGVGLDPGDTWSVEDLLEGLVARSGNDAAAALAVAIGGDIPGFVEEMRRDATALGLAELTLTEPDGLDDGNRLSARDLLVLTRVAMDDERFSAIAARSVVELPELGAIESRNTLLSEYPGADGVKTGYTAASGRCIVASAQRDGHRLVAVVLGSAGVTGHFADARTLLDHGFATFAAVPLAGPGPEVRLKVAGGWVGLDVDPAARALERVDLLVPEVDAQVAHRAELPGSIDGQVSATLAVSWNGSEVGAVPLRGDAATDRPGAPGLGAWLVDRTYAAMRTATDGDLWPPIAEAA